jgi:hypothetical protein
MQVNHQSRHTCRARARGQNLPCINHVRRKEGRKDRCCCVGWPCGCLREMSSCEQAGMQRVDSEVKRKKCPSNDHVSNCAARISPVPSRQGQFTWEQLRSSLLLDATPLSLSCICLPPPSPPSMDAPSCAGILNQQSYTRESIITKQKKLVQKQE